MVVKFTEYVRAQMQCCWRSRKPSVELGMAVDRAWDRLVDFCRSIVDLILQFWVYNTVFGHLWTFQNAHPEKALNAVACFAVLLGGLQLLCLLVSSHVKVCTEWHISCMGFNWVRKRRLRWMCRF